VSAYARRIVIGVGFADIRVPLPVMKSPAADFGAEASSKRNWNVRR